MFNLARTGLFLQITAGGYITYTWTPPYSVALEEGVLMVSVDWFYEELNNYKYMTRDQGPAYVDMLHHAEDT